MSSDYSYQKIARWEGANPIDQYGHYLDASDTRDGRNGPEARELTSPYGSLEFAIGYGSEDDEPEIYEKRGDWMTCFDYALITIKGKRMVILHSTVNTDSGGYLGGGEYVVVSRSEAPSYAMGMCGQAADSVSEFGYEHDEEGWNADPWHFARAVAAACGVKPYAGMSDDDLRRGPVPDFPRVPHKPGKTPRAKRPQVWTATYARRIGGFCVRSFRRAGGKRVSVTEAPQEVRDYFLVRKDGRCDEETREILPTLKPGENDVTRVTRRGGATYVTARVEVVPVPVEKDCPEDCPGCAKCYEDPSDYAGMGWIGRDGRP